MNSCRLYTMNQGSEVNKKHPSSGNTPLHVAAMNGHTGCVTALLGYGADRECDNRQGFKVNSCEKVVKFLMLHFY